MAAKPRTAPPPPQATTGSPDALALLARALTLLEQDQPAGARELLKLALEHDPEFALAWAQLAWALHDSSESAQRQRAAMERALALAASGSDVEHLFISASAHHLAGRTRQAAAAYEALLVLRPDHYWAARRLLELCDRARGTGQCMLEWVRLAELRPAQLRWVEGAARALAIAGMDTLAARYAERTRQLISPETVAAFPEAAARGTLYGAVDRWLAGEPTEALQYLEQATRELDRWPHAVRDVLAREIGRQFLGIGRLARARALFTSIGDPRLRHEMLARVLLLGESPRAAHRHLVEGAGYRDTFSAFLLAAAGDVRGVELSIASMEEHGVDAAEIALIRSALALEISDAPADLAPLRAAVDAVRDSASPLAMAGADLLAQALARRGDAKGAVGALEQTVRQRRRAAFAGAADLWMMCQSRLAALYRGVGRGADAARIESHLRALLAEADPGLPLLAALASAAPAHAAPPGS